MTLLAFLRRRILLILISLLLPTICSAVTITVDSTEDIVLPSNNGNCTLREAIRAATRNFMVDECPAGTSGMDTIVFADSLIGSSILLTADLSNSSDLIRESLTVRGPGSSNLFLDGDDSFQIFAINSLNDDQSFIFSGLTILQGSSPLFGGAISVGAGDDLDVSDMVFEANEAVNAGGAIHAQNAAFDGNDSEIIIRRSTFTGNRALGAAGGGAVRIGNRASLLIEDSSFVSNHSDFDGGAMIIFSNSQSPGIATITRSTFSGNSANRSGGAILSVSARQLSITHSTLTLNRSDADEDNDGLGGGLNSSNLTIGNTIVAGNSDFGSGGNNRPDINVSGSDTIISLGFNFIGNHSGASTAFPGGLPNTNADYVGTAASTLTADLDPISDNGGPTLTHLPKLEGTQVLIDKGSCSDELRDQRLLGNNRTKRRAVDIDDVNNGAGSDGCDIGAVELNAVEVLPIEEMCVPVQAGNGEFAVFCI